MTRAAPLKGKGPADAGPLDWTLLAGLVAMGGSSFTFIRVALETAPPAVVSVGRLWVAALALYAAMRWKGRRFPPLFVRTKEGARPHRLWAWMSMVGFVGYTVPFLLFPWAQQFVPSGLAGVYMAFMPIWTLLLAALFADERLTTAKIGGFVIAALGVAVLMGPDAIGGVSGADLAAQAALLLATLLYAASAVMSRRAPPARRIVFSAGIVLSGAFFSPRSRRRAGRREASSASSRSALDRPHSPASSSSSLSAAPAHPSWRSPITSCRWSRCWRARFFSASGWDSMSSPRSRSSSQASR
jgi:multidrug transporter EmrE-like cation transporter